MAYLEAIPHTLSTATEEKNGGKKTEIVWTVPGPRPEPGPSITRGTPSV